MNENVGVIVEYSRFVGSIAPQNNIAVLWATHLIDEIAASDRMVVLHNGSVRAKGTVDEVLKNTGAADINDAFYKLTQGGEQ